MKLTPLRFLFSSLLAATTSVFAAIPVGPAGTGVNTFGAQPVVGDWSTVAIGPQGPGIYTAAGPLIARAQQLTAAEINQALGSSSTQPPSPDPLARRNTSATLGLYLQTRPEDNEFTVLMATLRNDTGAGASTLTVSYTFGQAITAPTIVREEVPGYLAFYSLTGAAGSWQPIPALTTGTTGNLSATLNLGSWANGALLYIMWVDDNGSAGVIAPEQEGAYTIDNFQAVASGFDGPVGPAIPSGPRISVGVSGTTGINTFATQPTATEWSSLGVGGDLPASYTTAAALSARVIAVTSAEAVTSALGTSSTLPPSSDALARRNTAATGLYIQTRVTGTEYTLLMATLKNDSGAAVPALRVSYTFGTAMAADVTIAEEIPGHLGFFSLTGAPGSWQPIPEFTRSTPGEATATLNLGSWANGTLMYILWADDNAAATTTGTNVEGTYTIDNFQATVTASAPTAPAFTAQPASQSIAAGSTVVFSSTATSATSYRWQRNGADIAGATSATLVIANATAANAGSYTAIATNGSGTSTSAAATLTVATAATPAEVGRLINLAIRTNAGTGAQTLTVGFVVGGAGAAGEAPLLVRGIGPALSQFGVAGVLADPVATLFRGSTVVSTNNNWSGTDISARAGAVGAFPLTVGSLDAALAISPAPQSYTVEVTGNNGGTGLALAEIYDASASASLTATSPRLINVSARTQVGTDSNILIAGFVVGGTTAKTVLIRAIGPALGAFGVTGVLADPRLQLFAGTTLIRENDNWGGDAQLTAVGTSVGAFGIADAGSRDAVLLLTLAPGNYTAQVAGIGNGTGVALVEIYEVP
ncbi:MAG: hypothetical protein V4773_17485 [Verrucomicrobiota bacterium]